MHVNQWFKELKPNDLQVILSGFEPVTQDYTLKKLQQDLLRVLFFNVELFILMFLSLKNTM